MSIRRLLRDVKAAQTPDQFWAAQQQLAVGLCAEEKFIRKRRRQRNLIRRSKRAYVQAAGRELDRIRRIDEMIALCEASEEQHATRRGTVLYLGDTLAFKLLPEHAINTLCQNQSPGFFDGKKGRAREMKGAELAAASGAYALLHDLTHCLRIGDLSIIQRGSKDLIVEFEGAGLLSQPHEARKKRQHRRLDLVGNTLNESVKASDLPDLLRHLIPAAFIEETLHLDYHIKSFTDASRIGASGYSIIQPEEGLVYIATARDCPPKEFIPKFIKTVPRSRCAFVSLRNRVVGACPWVRPITLLPIPEDILAAYLEEEFSLFVYVDLDHLVKGVGQRSVSLRPAFDVPVTPCAELGEFPAGAFMFEGAMPPDGRFLVGPKLVHRVQYGLATLQSVVAAFIQREQTATKIPSATPHLLP